MTATEVLEKKFVKCRVRITMKPLEYSDVFFKMPTRDQILENLRDFIEFRKIDGYFEIVVTAEE